MNPEEQFKKERAKSIKSISRDARIRTLGNKFITETSKKKYNYNFDWFGRPVIQYPQDLIALQEIIWNTKPDLIIETGVAHGGSLIFSSSMLELLGQGEVIGIDIEIRSHNRKAIEAHPFSKRITLLEGSSIDPKIS